MEDARRYLISYQLKGSFDDSMIHALTIECLTPNHIHIREGGEVMMVRISHIIVTNNAPLSVYDDVLELREQSFYSRLKLRKRMKNRFFCKPSPSKLYLECRTISKTAIFTDIVICHGHDLKLK